MPPFLYRCPNTGFQVQGLATDEDGSEGANDVFVVTCLMCGWAHFVNPKTGEMPGERTE
jgi:RNase P subunit RPR2